MGKTSTVATLDNTSTLDTLESTSTLGTLDKTSTLGMLDNTSTLGTLDNTSTLGTLDNTSTLGMFDNTSTLGVLDNTSDTLTLARLDRENQGPWEFEYSYGEEADLHRHYNRCYKNPGHKNFIPVDKFSIEDLPEDYRDKDVFDYIRAVSDLTVRVSVKYVSDKRPATIPGSRKSDPGYSDRGQRRVTVGTGCVDIVSVCDDTATEYCKCKECRMSSRPETKFATITILTATHVVFDELEAEHTTCHLFFDRGGIPDSCSGVIALTGMFLHDKDVTEDVCCLEHYTHDLVLADRLDQTLKRMYEGLVHTKEYGCFKLKQRLDVLDRQPLLAIVSHPHGCSKQISLGRLTSAEVFNNHIHSLLYNTVTCPGSSGARVSTFVQFPDPIVQGQICNQTRIHPCVHRGLSGVQNENHFNIGTGVRHFQDTLTLAWLDREEQGPLEFEYSYGGEADLHQHYNRCNKNPDHKNFIPVGKFSIEDLPENYRDKDVLDYIRAVSDLTVRVSVNYVSDKRPATVAGSHMPYPGYSVRGQRRMTVGTGWVDSVIMWSSSSYETCQCKECRNSSQRETHFAMITVVTSAHIVYDDTEGEHTTCYLFFDRGASPDSCRDVITLTGMSSINIKITNDWCDMKHFTHDLDLAHKLQQTLSQASMLGDKIFMKTLTFSKSKNKSNVQDKQPLLCIVSHPHGCSKTISVGHWISIEVEKETNTVSHMYTTATCPGSSGALVCMPQALASSHEDVAFFTFRTVHCGTSALVPGTNFCRADPDVPMFQMLSQEIQRTYKEKLENNGCLVKDKDQNQDLAACEKNPGYLDVFRDDKFSMDNLPPFNPSDDVMKFLKLVSKSLKYVSQKKPETVTETDIPYPWYSRRVSHLTKVGTGWTGHKEVSQNTDCSCNWCEPSLTPATNFAYLSIRTATHIVDEPLDSQENIRHLLHDVTEAPNVLTEHLLLIDMCGINHDSTKPTCRLKHSTHNLQLVYRLPQMAQKQNHYIISLTENEDDRPSSKTSQNGETNIKQGPQLCIVVSHPHGSVKQVNISCYGNPDNAELQIRLYPCETRFTVLGAEPTHPGCG